LSEKIDRLEEISARIFRVIEKEPQQEKQVRTFLDYYLPTTQKLLDSYAEFEEAGVEGENLRQAKQRIEATMDTIVAGFENQLDSLYKAKTMDLDSDIRVMENMLRREKSSVEDDFGISVNGGKAQDIDFGGVAAQQKE
ncbi:MAG: 5-bromo-4-chloroindolyl phosphate hydrolysis family protein, partial [Oscillospiraceae bacterium]|nr:5-bromo-4-chloroindolyl phosphate hydrolysis family protein [Oscillospiraceae bacterium]